MRQCTVNLFRAATHAYPLSFVYKIVACKNSLFLSALRRTRVPAFRFCLFSLTFSVKIA